MEVTIYTLLNTSSSLELRTNAASRIITTYDLHFSVDDILKVFGSLKGNYYAFDVFRLTLTTNLRMFIAIVYAVIDNKMTQSWFYYLITYGNPQELGHTGIVSHDKNTVLKTWSAKQPCRSLRCTLYDYYTFDIRELILSASLRSGLQRHIDSKRVNTKRAIK